MWALRVFLMIASGVGLWLISSATVYAGQYGCSSGTDCDQGQAYAACSAHAAAGGGGYQPHQLVCQQANGLNVYQTYYGGTPVGSGGPGIYRFTGMCSARQNKAAGMAKATSGAGGSMCDSGCTYSPVGNSASIQLGSGPVYTPAINGWQANGSVCAAGDGTGTPVTTPEDCVQQGSLTQCAKPDGRQCVKASSGKQFCWKPTEQGIKFSQNDAAAAVQGSTSIEAPATKPANGGEWTQGPSGAVTVTSGGTSTTTNVMTWVSTFGSDGDGKAEGEGDGKEDGDSPTATSGAGCDQSSFQCSDMSSVQCNQLIQTWYLRCKGVELNGGANCDAPPECTGNAADCYVGKMLWNYRCEGKAEALAGSPSQGFDGEVAAEGNGADEPDVSAIGTGNTADTGTTLWQEKEMNSELDKLDASGFLGGSDQCPAWPPFQVAGSSFTIDMAPICSILRNVGVLVMALAYWLALRILAKSN